MTKYKAIKISNKKYLVEMVSQEKYAYFYYDDVHQSLYFLKESSYNDYTYLLNQRLEEVTVNIKSNTIKVALLSLLKINNTQSFKNIFDLSELFDVFFFSIKGEGDIEIAYCISKENLKLFFNRYLIEFSLWRDFLNRNLSLDTLSFYEITTMDIMKMIDIVQTYDIDFLIKLDDLEEV